VRDLAYGVCELVNPGLAGLHHHRPRRFRV